MGYKVLYRRYRPDSFESVVGQEYNIKMLKNAISFNKNAHAYIFTGPRGVGKTSTAKIFAKALNCENPVDGNPCGKCNSCLNFGSNPDIIEIDAASNNGVDEIRELINNVKLVPSNSKYKVYIIDEVHMLTTSAFNALLLTLEEPPAHVIFILATTDIQDVPITILSRCQRFDFKPISRKDIFNRLRFVCDEESIKASDSALEEIAIISSGGMRDALGMLDQLSSNDEEITQDMVSNYFGSISEAKIDELLTSVLEFNTEKIIECISQIKENGTNYAVFVEKIIERLRKIAVEISDGKSKYNFCFSDIYSFILDLNDCLTNININVDPYIIIEMAILKNMNVLKNNQYFPGNNSKNSLGNEKKVENSYNPGNNDSKIVGNSENSTENYNLGNNSVKETKKKAKKEEKLVINSCPYKIDVSVRINNCFVNASKEFKTKLSSDWINFMNLLMKEDRNLVSLLADCKILAASDKYVLLNGQGNSADLINEKIDSIERLYKKFSDLDYRFAAVSDDLWQKEVEKYRNNVKNKIQYNYVEENIEVNPEAPVEVQSDENGDIDDVAKDIFGSYDVE